MTYRNLPEHLLQAVSPGVLRQYVVENGWSLSQNGNGRFDVFNHPDRDLDQVLVPLNIAAPDYTRRVGDAILSISEVESRPVDQVLKALLRTGHLGHFRIPGEATRRDYAVYIMVATHRVTGERTFYVGKTGDNRDGCNPVISRVGNHFSFNLKHAQMRARVKDPVSYDFDYFYTTFGTYVPRKEDRDPVDLINEMERQLNRLAREAFGAAVINPLQGTGYVRKQERERRRALAAPERLEQLRELVGAVRSFVAKAEEPAS